MRPTKQTMPTKPTAPSRPERWHLDAGEAAIATLTIPADAARERCFEIACAMTVRVPTQETIAPWHQMTVQANGARQWQRRIASRNAGSEDGLDYRFRRTVPVAETLRITISVEGRGVTRARLVVEAEEA